MNGRKLFVSPYLGGVGWSCLFYLGFLVKKMLLHVILTQTTHEAFSRI